MSLLVGQPRVSLRSLDERTNPSGFTLDDLEPAPFEDFDDEGIDIGTCSTCGGYGTPGRQCLKPDCRELGGEFC